MLLVQRNSVFQALDARGVVDGIMEGTLRGATPAKLAGDLTAAASSLAQLLGPEHFRLLSDRLLDRVCACLGEGREDGFGLVEFERLVVDLSGWTLEATGRHLRLRTKWLSAWLAERLGSKRLAKSRYAEFLRDRLDIEEPVLGLLARNNLAVLRLQDGDLTALAEIVTAALGDELPGACFSLFNVVQMTRRSWVFQNEIGPIVRSALSDLPPEQRDRWLSKGSNSDETDERQHATGSQGKIDLKELVLHLARETCSIDQHPEGEGLELWPRPQNLLIASAPLADPPQRRHSAYSEAVSLLYAEDFPDTFSSQTPGGAVTEIVSTAIEEATEHADRHQFEQALVIVQQAKRLVAGSSERSHLRRLEAELDKLTANIETGQTRMLTGRFQNELKSLKTEVDEACREQGIERFRNRRQFLWPRFDRVRRLQRRLWPGNETDLTAPQAEMLERHLAKLEETRRLGETEGPFARLRELMPTDLDTLVGDDAYQLLKVCRTADPDCSIQNWKEIEKSFNRHNAEHHFRKALDLACDSLGSDPAALERQIRLAIGWDRRIAIRTAPLLALMHVRSMGGEASNLEDLRRKWLEDSELLVRADILGGGKVVPPQARRELMDEARDEVRRAVALFMQQQGDREAAERLFAELDRLFEPDLAGGEADDILGICRMLRDWQSVWPDAFLPDHPFHQLLARSEVTYLLRLAMRELQQAHHNEDAGEIRRHRFRARETVSEAIERGVWNREQAVEALKYYALSGELADLSWADRNDALKRLVEEFDERFAESPGSLTIAWLNETIDRYLLKPESRLKDPNRTEVEAEPDQRESLVDVLKEMESKAVDDVFQSTEERDFAAESEDSSESAAQSSRQDVEQTNSEPPHAEHPPNGESNRDSPGRGDGIIDLGTVDLGTAGDADAESPASDDSRIVDGEGSDRDSSDPQER